jgi:hypothetical protein
MHLSRLDVDTDARGKSPMMRFLSTSCRDAALGLGRETYLFG